MEAGGYIMTCIILALAMGYCICKSDMIKSAVRGFKRGYSENVK